MKNVVIYIEDETFNRNKSIFYRRVFQNFQRLLYVSKMVEYDLISDRIKTNFLHMFQYQYVGEEVLEFIHEFMSIICDKARKKRNSHKYPESLGAKDTGNYFKSRIMTKFNDLFDKMIQNKHIVEINKCLINIPIGDPKYHIKEYLILT